MTFLETGGDRSNAIWQMQLVHTTTIRLLNFNRRGRPVNIFGRRSMCGGSSSLEETALVSASSGQYAKRRTHDETLPLAIARTLLPYPTLSGTEV